MASERLKKYLAYYQKTLREDPENIEARLRLAALFREMGSIAHAIDEYVTASKLLAAQGLPLEAIAACKAVLELDPSHREVQFFLARLFAQAPDALGRAARVARPVTEAAQRPRSQEVDLQNFGNKLRLETLSTDELDAFVRSGEQPITLAQPKGSAFSEEAPTRRHASGQLPMLEPMPSNPASHGVPPESLSGASDDTQEVKKEDAFADTKETTRRLTRRLPLTSDQQTRPEIAVDFGIPSPSHASPEVTRMVPSNEETHMIELDSEFEFAASKEQIARARAEVSDDLRQTVEYSMIEDLRTTQALDPDELAALHAHGTQASSAAELLRARRTTLPLAIEAPQRNERQLTSAWHPLDRTLKQHISPELLRSAAVPAQEEEGDDLGLQDDTAERLPAPGEAHREQFALNVFELDELHLSDDSMGEMLDAFGDDEALGAEVTETHSDTGSFEASTSPSRPSLVSVRREDLPEIPLLSRLNQFAFVELLQRARLREVEAGEPILSPGHELKNLYIVLNGELRAHKRYMDEELPLSQFEEGDFFGEFALLTGRDHSATVTAVRRSRLLEISEELVHQLAEYDLEIWETLWDYYHSRMLNNLMVSDTIFRHLEPARRDEVIDAFELREYQAGEAVLEPEEPCGFVCLVLFGLLQLTPSDTLLPSKTLREGEFFGFVASLSDEPCQATIRAVKDVSLLCLPARRFRELTRHNAAIAAEIRAMLRERVRRSDLFLTGITRYGDSGFGQ